MSRTIIRKITLQTRKYQVILMILMCLMVQIKIIVSYSKMKECIKDKVVGVHKRNFYGTKTILYIIPFNRYWFSMFVFVIFQLLHTMAILYVANNFHDIDNYNFM